MKTIKEWLLTIPDPDIREKAIKAMNNHPFMNNERKTDTLATAILDGFNWSHTDDGEPFWHQYYVTL